MDVDTNPMQNPVVLTRLFEVCELADLRSFRLVAKDWYLLSLSRFRRDMKLIIRQKPVAFKHHLLQGGLQWKNTRDELKVGNRPFQSIVIHGLEIRSEEQFDKPEALQLYKLFWNIHGGCISKLELIDHEIYSTEALENVIFVDTPNLRELKLTRPKFMKGVASNHGGKKDVIKVQPNLTCLSMKKVVRVNWELFFRHFPNILRLELSEVDNELHITPLVDTLEELQKNGGNPKLIRELVLDQIYCDSVHGDGVKRLLELPNVKLTSLHIDVSECELDDFSILPLALRLHGEILKEFRIIESVNNPDYGHVHHYMNPYPNFPFQTEPFVALTDLRLEYAVNHNLHFLNQYPNLKIFHMIQYLGEQMLTETEWNKFANFKLIHLEDFKFFVKSHPNYPSTPKHYYIPEEIMERFGKLMPSVKYLSAQVKTAGLRVICRNWRELSKLELQDVEGFIDDEGVTGIEKGNEDDSKRFPNVSDLRYLRQLSIRGGRNMNIGEPSVNKVFLQLPFLDTLNMSQSWKKWCDPTFQSLLRQLPLHKVDDVEDVSYESEVSSSSEYELSSINTDESQSTDSDC